MGVIAAFVYQRHPSRVHVRRAMPVVALVVGDGARGDDDQAVAGMAVPAGGSARLPDVALDVEVRLAFRPLPRQPDVAVDPAFPEIGRDHLVEDVDLAEGAHDDRGPHEAGSLCCPQTGGVGYRNHERGDGDYCRESSLHAASSRVDESRRGDTMPVAWRRGQRAKGRSASD